MCPITGTAKVQAKFRANLKGSGEDEQRNLGRSKGYGRRCIVPFQAGRSLSRDNQENWDEDRLGISWVTVLKAVGV